MRSRYTAFAIHAFTYLQQTVPLNLRDTFDPIRIAEETARVSWEELRILRVSGGTETDTSGEVEYSARYTDNGHPGTLNERSTFRKEEGIWYYTEGTIEPSVPGIRTAVRTGRNAPCPCGSGKKYKKCCGK